MTRLRVDARLIEEAVFLRTRSGELAGDPRVAAWQREREDAYRLADPAQRARAFETLARETFQRLGLDAPLHRVLDACPHVRAGVDELHVRRAQRPRDEGSDLFGNGSEPRRLLVLVTPERLAAPERLLDFLLDELLHAEDMLQPAFGFRPELPEDLQDERARRELVRDRLRVLWEARVLGRAAALRGLPARREPAPAFARAFQGALGREEVGRLHEQASAGQIATFAALLAAARLAPLAPAEPRLAARR